MARRSPPHTSATSDPERELRDRSPELGLVVDVLRGEFDAKISALKGWGLAMTFGGGFAGGIAAVFFPQQTADGVQAVLGIFA